MKRLLSSHRANEAPGHRCRTRARATAPLALSILAASVLATACAGAGNLKLFSDPGEDYKQRRAQEERARQRSRRAERERLAAIVSAENEEMRESYFASCLRRGGPMWQRFARQELTDETPLSRPCPAPGAEFRTKWTVSEDVTDQMMLCLDMGGSFGECEADADVELTALKEARRGILPTAGDYDWSYSTESEGGGLTLTIDEWGKVEWRANVLTCGRKGHGYVEVVDGELRLVTTKRDVFNTGPAPTSAVWKCGSMKLELPFGVEPNRRSCVRLGSSVDRSDQRASDVACANARIFPELNKQGVILTRDGDAVAFVHDGEQIRLDRR
jgi:hypothetical protein